ncbi:MAG TPA: hypothetical protein VFQ34_03895 [Nitrospiraceae bacterium]|nr:hypothetical protein [Nitrospiraceae bacterium]
MQVAAALLVTACAAQSPASRLDQYVGSVPPAADQPLPAERPLHAAMIVLSDTTAPDAAPSLPDEARLKVIEELREELSRGYPVIIDKFIPATGNALDDDGRERQWIDLAGRYGTDYVLVVILSSTEQEYPTSVFLGWTTHRQPGFRRDNWSLAEAALLDGRTGGVLLRAEGRAWATLDSPTAPGISQWYPVIYLRPQDPERRIWPPTYEGAPITLRLVAMKQAVQRLASNFQRAWIAQRDRELAAAPLR